METGKTISESDNAPRELPNQIVYLLGALGPEVMTVWQSQVLGSYGAVVLADKSKVLVIAHFENDEKSDNPFDKKIVWWREWRIHDSWRPT